MGFNSGFKGLTRHNAMDTNELYLFIMYPTCNTYFTHIILPYLITLITSVRWSQWPRGLRCVSAAARLLGLRVRITRGAWMFFYCECRVLSGRGVCEELITRPEESYRLCCVVVCDLETSRMGAPYIHDISSLWVNNLTLILLTWRKW